MRQSSAPHDDGERARMQQSFSGECPWPTRWPRFSPPAFDFGRVSVSLARAISFFIAVAAAAPAADRAAAAGLSARDLDKVAMVLPLAARVPADSRWRDESGASMRLGQVMGGRPALLIFADYTCSTLCGPILTFVIDALSKSGLPPRDYRLVVLGIDPKDRPGEAASMKRERIPDHAVASSAVFLTSDAATIRRTADAVGYRFAYDAAHDQFAHPAVVLVLTGDGRVTRVLSGLGISADDFRLALVEAGQGRLGTFRDQVRLLCYGFDPSTGIYTLSIYRALTVASALSMVVLGAGIGWLSLRRPHSS